MWSTILLTLFMGGLSLASDSYKIKPCGNKPNCVSSTDQRPDFYFTPLNYTGSLAQAKDCIKNMILNKPRVRLITDSKNYLHFEFKSFLFRFVDDVEFLFNDDMKVIQLRSASRVGYSDWGVNRARLESLQQELSPALLVPPNQAPVGVSQDPCQLKKH